MSLKELSHKEIQKLFKQTRPSGLLLPNDLKILKSNDIDIALASEQTHLGFILNSIEDYIQKETEKKDSFRIKTIRKSVVHGKSLFYINAPPKGNSAEILYKTGNRFDEQLSIAISLAVMILVYIPRERNEEYEVTDNDILFFAQLLLELYAITENGALLRHMHVLPKDSIKSEIKKRYNFDESLINTERI